MKDELMTREEAAKYLNVSLRTVDTLIHNKNFVGLIYFGKCVRISKRVLLKYINQKDMLFSEEDVTDRMLTRQEVADILKISISSVNKLIKNKYFYGAYIVNHCIRISEKKLFEYIEENLQYKI